MNRAKPRTHLARGLALAAATTALAATIAWWAGAGTNTEHGGRTETPRVAIPQALGEFTVVVENSRGAPLHREPRSPKIKARLGEGTRVEVLGDRFEGQWLFVRAATGVEGWLARRYLGAAQAAAAPHEVDVAFSSADRCRSLLRANRSSLRERETARVGSYNLRWFPDGGPGREGPDPPRTDLEWLACAIASLDVDVLAVQEIKALFRTRELMRHLMTRLDLLTDGSWRVRLDDCPDSSELHVGFFYNSAKVQVDHWQTLGELNPFDSACARQLRPGLAGYFTFNGGLDLYIVSVHLKSTRAQRSFGLRARSLARVPAALSRLKAVVDDDDVLVVGDFNTMGCWDCVPGVSPGDELAGAARALAGPGSRLRIVPSDAECTQYSGGRPNALDLFAAANTMRELLPASRVHVRGACVELGCRRTDAERMPPAYARLSDHCPLVLDLVDRDLD